MDMVVVVAQSAVALLTWLSPLGTQVAYLYVDRTDEAVVSEPRVLGSVTRGEEELPYPRWWFFAQATPATRLAYFNKRLQEQVVVALARRQERIVLLKLAYAGERLRELERLIPTAQVAYVATAAEHYKEALGAAVTALDSLDPGEEITKALLQQTQQVVTQHHHRLQQLTGTTMEQTTRYVLDQTLASVARIDVGH